MNYSFLLSILISQTQKKFLFKCLVSFITKSKSENEIIWLITYINYADRETTCQVYLDIKTLPSSCISARNIEMLTLFQSHILQPQWRTRLKRYYLVPNFLISIFVTTFNTQKIPIFNIYTICFEVISSGLNKEPV